jgi:hypothetical protein
MSTKSDYTKDEWLLLYRVPSLVGAAVLAADESGMWGTTKETFMLSKEWAKGVTEYPSNVLIQSLLKEKEGPEGDPMKDAYKGFQEDVKRRGLDQFTQDIVTDCGQAADLLDEKSSSEEAAGYKAWVMTIGRKVASAAKEKGSGSDKVSDREEALLKQVAEALRFDTQGSAA